MQLSSMPGPSSYVEPEPSPFIFPVSSPSQPPSMPASRASTMSLLTDSIGSLPPSEEVNDSTTSLDVMTPTTASEDGSIPSRRHKKPSGLSLLRPPPSQAGEFDSDPTPQPTPRPFHRPLSSPPLRSQQGDAERQQGSKETPTHVHWGDPNHSPRQTATSHTLRSPSPTLTETTPLLRPSCTPPVDSNIPPPFLSHSPDKSDTTASKSGWRERIHLTGQTLKKVDPFSPSHLQTALRSIPAVLLGCLLNILDGVSCA